MHRNRWLLLVVALATVLSLAAVGCGGDDDDDGAAQDETGATDTGATEPAAEQVLRIAWSTEPPSLDPGKATDTTSTNVINALMDPLVKLESRHARARAVGG